MLTVKISPPLYRSASPHSASTSPGEAVAALLDQAENVLQTCDIDTPRLDAEVLLAHVLKVSRTSLYGRLQDQVSAAHRATFQAWVRRRTSYEPVAYITGTQEFWSLEFHVNRHVLIPRPDTEIVIETALQLLQSSATIRLKILDVGTGSGCIAIVLATQLPHARIIALDSETDALSLATQNANSLQTGRRISFCRGNLLTAFSPRTTGFDLIISNPPYIDTKTLDSLQPEVRSWEPRPALDGGSDGLDFYRRLLYDAADLIRPNGWLVMEIGADQKDSVLQLGCSRRNFRFHSCVEDYAGRDRVVVFQKTA